MKKFVFTFVLGIAMTVIAGVMPDSCFYWIFEYECPECTGLHGLFMEQEFYGCEIHSTPTFHADYSFGLEEKECCGEGDCS